jgi:hypothetical protein
MFYPAKHIVGYQNCLLFESIWVHPRLLVGSAFLIFLVVCVCFFYLVCLSSFCVLCLMFPLSLNCPVFIVPSVFSNVYKLTSSNIEIHVIVLIWLVILKPWYLFESKHWRMVSNWQIWIRNYSKSIYRISALFNI